MWRSNYEVKRSNVDKIAGEHFEVCNYSAICFNLNLLNLKFGQNLKSTVDFWQLVMKLYMEDSKF